MADKSVVLAKNSKFVLMKIYVCLFAVIFDYCVLDEKKLWQKKFRQNKTKCHTKISKFYNNFLWKITTHHFVSITHTGFNLGLNASHSSQFKWKKIEVNKYEPNLFLPDWISDDQNDTSLNSWIEVDIYESEIWVLWKKRLKWKNVYDETELNERYSDEPLPFPVFHTSTKSKGRMVLYLGM